MVFTLWEYDNPLIQTYTLPYVKIIQQLIGKNSKIILLTTGAACKRGLHRFQNIEVITINKNNNNLLSYLKNYFFLKRIIEQEKITVFHNWCTPVGIYSLPLFNKKTHILILDSFEPHAEAMVENGEWKKNGLKFKVLFYIEKRLAKKATHVIFAANGMQDYIKEKYKLQINNYFVKPACVDLDKFSNTVAKNKELIEKYNLQGKIIGLYAGKFGGIYLENEIVDFFETCYNYWGENFVALILSNHNKSEIESLFFEKKVIIKNTIITSVNFDVIENYIGLADFALCPVKSVPSKRYCSPIKNGEYWAMGLPVVITKNISTDSDLIEKNECGYVLQNLNQQEYKNAIVSIEKIMASFSYKTKIRNLAETHRSFSIAHVVYKQIYN